jgi:hypothetical protein
MTKTGWRGKRRAVRLELERLEDRLAPATNITVIAGAAGAGTLDHFLSATNGTITTANDPGDTAATLSTGALQGVGPGVAIRITADNDITFSNVGALTLQTAAGAGAAFTANAGAIAFANPADALATAGGSITFSAGTNLTAANLNSNGGDVALTADTMTLDGSVNAGAGVVTLQPFTAGRPIDLGTNPSSGALGLSQADLGHVAAGVLRVGADAAGAVTVSNDVTLAGVPTLSIITGGGVSGFKTITVQNLRLSAGAAVFLEGESAAGNHVGTVAAEAGLTAPFSFGRSFTFFNQGALVIGTVDGVSGLAANGGDITAFTTAGDLTVDQHVAGLTVTLGAGQGGADELINNAAVAGRFVTLTANRMALAAGAINAGPIGSVSLSPPGFAPIDLGGTSDPIGTLQISNSELHTITAGFVSVGDSTTGALTITAPIAPTTFGALSLVSGSTITESGAGSVAIADLDLKAGTVDLTLNPSDVTGSLTGQSGGSAFSFTNSVGFSVGANNSDDNGINTAGALTLTALTGTLTVNGPLSASTVNLNADDMAINAPIQTSTVALRPVTPTRVIDLGTKTPGDLGLTAAELAEITALLLRIGDTADPGDIRVTAAVSVTSNVLTGRGVNELSLLTGGAIVEAGGSIAGQGLNLQASRGIGDAAPLITEVGGVGFANLVSGAVRISNTADNETGSFGVGSPDGLTDSVNDGGATNLTTTGTMDMGGVISAGTLTATAEGPTPPFGVDDIDAAGALESTGGDVVLRAAHDVRVGVGGGEAVVKSDAGNVFLDVGFGAPDGSGGAVIFGSLQGTNPTVNGDGGADAGNTLLLDFADGAALPDGLTFNGNAAGHDTMTVSDADGATMNGVNADADSPHAYVIDGARVVRDSATTIAYTNLAGVTITGGDASDTFDVTPSATTAFTVHGGLPTPQGPPPGDALTVETAGTADPMLSYTLDPSNGFSGSWTFGDRMQVHFDGMERLTPPGIVAPAGGTVVVNGTSGDDVLVVTATGPDSGSYSLNGGPPIALAGVSGFTFNGGGGADTMIVNNPAGDLFRPPGGVTFNGALGSSLNVVGGDATQEVFTYAPNSPDGGHNGSILLIGALGTVNYTYSELSGVLVNAGTPQEAAFSLPDDGLDNQTVLAPSATPGLLQLSSAASGFAPTTFAAASGSAVLNVQGAALQSITAQAPPGAAVLVVNGTGLTVLSFDAQGRPVGTLAGALTFDGAPVVEYTGLFGIPLLIAGAVDAAVGPDTADRATAFVGLTPQERFVQTLYLDDLGRPGAVAELDNWVGLYTGLFNVASAAGVPAAQAQFLAQQAVATGIEHSAEARERLVQSWYLTFLGRAAVGGEERGWVNALLAGASEEQVLSGILASPEFAARTQALTGAASPDEAYVEALYLLLLNRPGDTGGVSGWVAALPVLGRQGAALAFLTGAEFRFAQFQGYYNALLHRPAEDSILADTWVLSNLNIDAARIGFEASPEFFLKGCGAALTAAAGIA